VRAYSADFRLSVIHAYETGQGSQRQLARLFGISVSFVPESTGNSSGPQPW